MKALFWRTVLTIMLPVAIACHIAAGIFVDVTGIPRKCRATLRGYRDSWREYGEL